MHARLESSITEAACICQENVIREENIMNEEIVLCAANSYEQKFYLNPEFDNCRSCVYCIQKMWAES